MKLLARMMSGTLLGLLLCLPAMPAEAAEEDSARQLLVMLQLPKPHYRPDSSYAGNYGDGVGLQARKQVVEALARKHELQLQSEWPMPLVGVDCFVMRLAADDTRTPEQAASEVAKDSHVAWAQAMQVFHGRATQDEPLYPTQPTARQWHLADLHQMATGQGVRVAVIDSGVDVNHPDLAGQVQLNENFVDGQPLVAESHGTAVAGIIAARADNHLGIAGVAPRSRILALRACWQGSPTDTVCTSLSLAKALQTAIQERAQVVNMSLSGPVDRLIASLIDAASARGMLVVAALGSTAEPFPASHRGVLAAGNALPLPAGVLLAPGKEVPTTAPGGGWTLVTGTSFSAAQISGLLALLSELDHSDKGAALRSALVFEPQGRVDTCATLERFVKGAKPACGLNGMDGLGHTSE
ncbi:MAG TPA: S8 family serine peptidase [Burkholderiaceae bacterium]|jgi:subtilisin family serine protease